MSENEIVLSGSEETLKPVITLLFGIHQMLGNQQGGQISMINSAIKRKHKPQITLYFREENIRSGHSGVEGEISFRIMSKESNTITEREVKAVASIIKRKFGTGGGFLWNKGKVMCSYTDWDSGYQLQLLCQSEAEGRRVIEQVLDIRGFSPDWENMNVSRNVEPSKAYPEIPNKQTILGKSTRLPRRRPLAKVRFQYALLILHGMPNPICLVDRSGQFSGAIERA